jgi:hypothetical protein
LIVAAVILDGVAGNGWLRGICAALKGAFYAAQSKGFY